MHSVGSRAGHAKTSASPRRPEREAARSPRRSRRRSGRQRRRGPSSARCPRRSGWASRSSRTSCNGLPSPWRTVTTKRGPRRPSPRRLDRLGAVDVAGGLEHEEQRVAEHLELRPLVGVHGVLDGDGCSSKRLPTASTTSGSGRGGRSRRSRRGTRRRLPSAARARPAALPVPLVVEPQSTTATPTPRCRRRRTLGGGRRGRASVAARQRDPGQAVGRHGPSLPASAPRRRLHGILIRARESPCALDGAAKLASVIIDDLVDPLAALVVAALFLCSRAELA